MWSNNVDRIIKDRTKLLRAMALAIKVFDKTEKQELAKIVFAIKKDEKKHFLSVSQDSTMQVSYSRAEADKLNLKRRVKSFLGRYIYRNVKYNKDIVNDYIMNLFVATVWSEFTLQVEKDLDVEILKGLDIKNKYASCDSISHSCMTGENSDLTEFYSINPDKVALICFEGIRALLWTTDQGVKVLDRCYPSGHHSSVILRKWALSKGYILRTVLDKVVEGPIIELSDKKYYTITTTPCGCYPFLDTFCFGSFVNDKLILSNIAFGYEYEFRRAQGSFDRFSSYCYFCDKKLNESNYLQFRRKIVCDACFSSRLVPCDMCGKLEDNNYIHQVGEDKICCKCYDNRF